MNAEIADEFASYEEQIKKYCRGEMDETRVQKYRLHFGTYAQRQEGVQMQRIKIPGRLPDLGPIGSNCGCLGWIWQRLHALHHP